MDTTDPEILFDEDGQCNHCIKVKKLMDARPSLGILANQLNEKVSAIKAHAKSSKSNYDCIIGLSGGVDSTYVAVLVKQLGLKALAVHMDGGWNSEIAVSNIEGIVKGLDFDLVTHVVDWEAMRKLQLSFLKAGVVNADIPQDHAFVAVLFQVASQHKIRYVISGHNLATESILPVSHQGHSSADLWYLKDVHNKNGDGDLRGFPTFSILDLVRFRMLRGIEIFNILDYVDYNKAEAKDVISREVGWRDYGGKHYESMWTRFFQSYYLVKRFGIDKRLSHLSSLIMSGQITRDDALMQLNTPSIDAAEGEALSQYVANKLGVGMEELQSYVNAPIKEDNYRKFQGSFLYRLKAKLWRKK